MTLPSIEATLKARNLNAADVTEAEAKAIVYDAIRTDLAEGVAFLSKFKKYNWDGNVPEYAGCVHCDLKDINVRRQVIRLAAYHPLRRFVQEELGLMVALDTFEPTSNDGGPSARLLVEPVERRLFQGQLVKPGKLSASPAQTWQVMNWGPNPNPPEKLSEEEATEKLWAYAQQNLAGGLQHLRETIEADDRLDADGSLLPQLIELIGVPGMHAVVTQKLGRSFNFYNCHASSPVPVKDDKGEEKDDDQKILAAVSFKTQLIGQAHSEMMHC